MAIQQELKPQPATQDDDLDELYEEEPRHRSWGAIASVVLAVALVFVGYQWHQASAREQILASQISSLRADGEAQRLRAEEAQRQVDGLQRRLTALGTEKESLTGRLAALEKAAHQRQTAAGAARETAKPRAVPVAGKKGR